MTDTTQLLRRLVSAQVAGCTCMTKTPELRYHAEDCHYRLFAEAHAAISELQERLRPYQPTEGIG